MTPEQRREVNEAILAGRRALASLEEAEDALDSASRWGLVDILAGGLLTSLVKQARIGDAREALAAAQADLMAFTREASDVRSIAELRVDVGSLNTVIDVLLDNPLVDLYVQKKIDDAQDVVEAALTATRTVLARLEAM
ncbi:hypothetical protein [Olsenella profusa]|uniref:Uncharacterized protein n=1 Tax=Olsenella profusa TaxID=138595 RepID=A0ABS2F4Q7_9ACTN|nr:hypothetical protein [Olsenella profusa]MBM6775504.1 hypothetical protein [Olsenella profusa]